VRTPGRKLLVLPTPALAGAVAAEWRGQGTHIDPATMALTTLVNTAIDRVAAEAAAVRAEIRAYAATDLVCYRAGTPATLAARQSAHWDPVLRWAETAIGARFVLAGGIVHVDQPPASLDAVDGALTPLAPLHLAAVHVATTLTGSALVALALGGGALRADAAWTAAHVDEDWQAEQWGEDAEAARRRAHRRREFDAAALLLAAFGGG
jgi:chaperone required for assembly of F1-ATPase